MKILKVKTTTGFKMLEKDLEINFLTKTRVDKNSVNDELVELETDFYYPLETVFIGKNSSGKTTILELISIVFEIVSEGRVRNYHFDNDDPFSIDIIFYESGVIYRYLASYKKDEMKNSDFMTIVDESLTKTTLKDSYKKDLSNASFFKVSEFKENINLDTSNLPKVVHFTGIHFGLNVVNDTVNNFKFFYRLIGEKIFMTLLHLFDDSVEYIKPIDNNPNLKDAFLFKRIGRNQPATVDASTLAKLLSEGTIRGLNLYALSILVFMLGGHIVVDEIESSFNRNLIENLIMMFNDSEINKQGGSIIYSTHYSEILDIGNRCDNVNVLHRENNNIKLKNLSTDYDLRTEILKSAQFNENTFDTLINYERLMDLKDAIRERNK